ncbi:F-box/kelch-repeat protein At3g06240-like [Mercurialis annua]|uniref:F-box/kelch-repeat protein At3g06240-like n=1 Tax=Mercurialis annua TaxID=3986 RepID=UPI00215EE03D|nr:F-box/kelch-repeat protein At3g06240-like [Mercurialis annua]
MSNYLSEELVAEILKRLPVKSLLKFKRVCKSWYSLITNPNFISLHLAHTTEANETSSLIMKTSHRIRQFVLVNDNGSVCELKESDLVSFHINSNSSSPVSNFEFVGSCNGLVCLTDNPRKHLILWNPAVGEFITTSSWEHNYKSDVVVGFGFDSKKRDYKVVRILVDSKGMASLPFAEIFELSSNSWRTIMGKNQKYDGYAFVTRAYLNGVVHWIAYKYCGIHHYKKLAVASLDLSTETFDDLMLPDVLTEISKPHLILKVYGQSLAVVQYEWSPSTHYNAKCCIWVMKDYGAPESWSKQFTIDLGNHGVFKWVLIFQGNGRILVEKRDGELASYDTETQRVARLGVHGYYYSAHPYTESLVLLKEKNNKK